MKLFSRCCLAGLFAVLASSACGVTARGRFDSYGDYDAQVSRRPIVASFDDIKLFYGTAPHGFTLRENELKVEPGFDHQILGSARVVTDDECGMGGVTKRDVIRILKKLARKHGGNAVIYANSAVSNAPRDLCAEIAGKDALGTGWVVVLSAKALPGGAAASPATATPAAPPPPAPPAAAAPAPAPAPTPAPRP